MENYTVVHIGKGKFQVKLENGEIKSAGHVLCGMIRYTYFEDYDLPEIGWSVTRTQLYEDYIPKLQKDLGEGKIKPKFNPQNN